MIKLKTRLMAVVALAVATCAIAAAERVDYVTGSNVQRRQMAAENRGVSVAGSSPIALAFAPGVECPAADYDVTGFRFSLFAGDHVDVYGLDIGIFGNFVKREVGGLQISGLFNVVGESDCAVQIAAACNYCKGDFGGVQIGLVNVVEKGRGVQVGLVNRANILYGVQIGVLNFIEASTVSVFPILNCAF